MDFDREHGGDMALPMPGEGAVKGRREAYETSILEDLWAKFKAALGHLSIRAALDLGVFLLSLGMVVFPFFVFLYYWHRGVLFLAPPLLAMFLGGIAGLTMPGRPQ
jgi:hypothetical protein